MQKINLGLSDAVREQVSKDLNILLADEYMLYTKTLKYHWNVEGKWFGPLHLLFRQVYEQLFLVIDDIAERVRALGHYSYGTLNEFSSKSSLEEKPGFIPDYQVMIADLVADHETVIRLIRNKIKEFDELGDVGTSNFLQELIVKHEKTTWMLRAHLA